MNKVENSYVDKLSQLFLRTEVEGKDRVSLAKVGIK